MRSLPVLLMILCTLMVASCGKKDTVPESSGSTVGESAAGSGQGEGQVGAGSDIPGGAGSASAGPPGVANIIYFDFDRSDIRPEYASLINSHAKHLASARQALFDGIFADAQRFCHSANGLAFAIKEDERFTVSFGNVFQGTPEQGLFFVADGMVRRERLERRRFVGGVQRFGCAQRLATFAAKRAVDSVPRNPAQPRAQFARFAQHPEVLPGGDEGFLGQVFALAEAARGAVGERADQRLISGDNGAERVTVARKALRYKVGIGCVWSGPHAGGHHITASVAQTRRKVTDDLKRPWKGSSEGASGSTRKKGVIKSG